MWGKVSGCPLSFPDSALSVWSKCSSPRGAEPSESTFSYNLQVCPVLMLSHSYFVSSFHLTQEKRLDSRLKDLPSKPGSATISS